MVITIPYQLILKRLYDQSFKGRIETNKARRILTFYCRIPKNLVTPVINEMIKRGWIEFENCRYLIILERVDCDIYYRHPGTQREYGELEDRQTLRKRW